MTFAALAAGALTCGSTDRDDNQFREDVILCEDAVARLARCCPDFPAERVLCDYDYTHDEGCGPTTTKLETPALTIAESDCVRDTPCEELAARGICERAAAATPYESSTTADDGQQPVTEAQTHAPVCP